ncbi:TonB-dependent siderophore receptor [Niabella sp. CJ426]|uniref:TonB-dependent siderophore receptor n=1 Tax=Niabella sp. CJ426 TaxID=3393740 RepID=UPI003D08731E
MTAIKSFLGVIALLLISVTAALAQQGTGKITGKITTSDNNEAQGVTVELTGKRQSTITNESGYFSFNKLAPGNYTVRISLIGHDDTERQVTVTAGQTSQIDLQLSISATNLNEVVVVGHKNGINVNTASNSLRVQTPLIELSQNVQVVTSKVLADQQIISMSDGLIRNVSGTARSEHWGDLYTNIVSRGSQIQAFRNGMNVVASYWGPLTEDMSFVDRIEFVKGPAGFMLANGDPSGLYNVVTKKPTGATKGEVNFTLGSFDLYRGSLDLDGALSKDKKLLYRLNVAAQNRGSQRDYEYNNRFVIAPVISYQLDDKSKLTLEYNGQFARMTEVGSYYVFSRKGYGTFPAHFTYTNPGLPPTKINDHSGYLTFEHNFSDNWKLTAQGSYFGYDQKGMSSWPSYLAPSGDSLIRNIGIWDAKSTMAMGQVFLNGTFNTGSIRHRVLAGIDAANKNYYADWGQSHDLDTIGALFDPYNPTYGTPVNGYPVFDRTQPIEERAVAAGGIQKQRYSSIYVQDEIAFFEEKLRLTLAGRYTDVSQVYGVDVEYSKAKRFTPRVGLSYSINKSFSAYALYDQAFTPQAGRLFNGGKIKPITGNNWELGLKKNWFEDRWSTTLSVYRILKQNELTGDPVHSSPSQGYSMVLGEKVARGVEFDARGTIVPGFTAIANYAFTDAEVTKVSEGAVGYTEGQLLPGYAKHTTNAWLSYEIQKGGLQGLGINGGFTSLIDRYTGWSTEGQQLPDYFKVDGGIFYSRNKYKVTLNVFNILDKYLFSGSYSASPTVPGDWSTSAEAYYYQAEPPRNVRLSITYSF